MRDSIDIGERGHERSTFERDTRDSIVIARTNPDRDNERILLRGTRDLIRVRQDDRVACVPRKRRAFVLGFPGHNQIPCHLVELNM